MSEPQNKIKLFEWQQVRAEWDSEAEKWWFSVLDIIAVLTDQPDYKKVRNYWKWLKNKLIAEGSQLVSVTNQLKLTAADGKKYLTDVADTEQILRLVQSIPSKRAELVLNMLAEVAATDISQVRKPEGFAQSAAVAKEGAKTAKAARLQLEKSTGKLVVSKLNAKKLAAQQLENEPKGQRDA